MKIKQGGVDIKAILNKADGKGLSQALTGHIKIRRGSILRLGVRKVFMEEALKLRLE